MLPDDDAVGIGMRADEDGFRGFVEWYSLAHPGGQRLQWVRSSRRVWRIAALNSQSVGYVLTLGNGG